MREFGISVKLMGSAFELGVVQENEKRADEILQAGISEIKRIENLLSEFLENSQTTRINQHAFNKPVIVDKEVFDLIKRCQDISTLTGGCFDISVSPLKKLYNFKKDNFQMPGKEAIDKTLYSTGYKKLYFTQRTTAFLLQMKTVK